MLVRTRATVASVNPGTTGVLTGTAATNPEKEKKETEKANKSPRYRVIIAGRLKVVHEATSQGMYA